MAYPDLTADVRLQHATIASAAGNCLSSNGPLDIIFDVMWSVELEPEVVEWIDSLPVKEFAVVLAAVERLSVRGSDLRPPASRSLGQGLFELRFNVGHVARRITFFFAEDRRIVLLTAFRKQRRNERVEVRRARQAMQRCIAEGHIAEEGH